MAGFAPPGQSGEEVTQVLQCGGVVVYQLLCGRDVAKGDRFATQMRNYCYLVVNTLDRSALAVDVAWDVKGVLDVAKQLGVEIRGSIYTHYHFDHCGGDVDPMFTGGREVSLQGARELEKAGGQIWAGAGDVDTIQKQCNLENRAVGLEDGDVIECGDLLLHAIHTPGHTPGSVCIFAAPRCLSPRASLAGESGFQENLTKAESGLLITGDCLFVGSSGATHFPGGSPAEMHKSLARLAKLHPDVVVLPGHAYSDPFTTIGKERHNNSAMQAGMSRVPMPLDLPPCVACLTSGQSCGPKGFVIGRKMRIRGLRSEAGKPLNGRFCMLTDFTESSGRYGVQVLATSETKALKPENVQKLEEADAEAVETESFGI